MLAKRPLDDIVTNNTGMWPAAGEFIVNDDKLVLYLAYLVGGGDRNPGVKGVESLWETGEERAGNRILKVVGTRRNRKPFCNIA